MHLAPQTFSDDLERILAVLHNAKLAGTQWQTAVQISGSLRDECGISLHWRTIQTVLMGSREFVDRRKRQHRWHFTILTAGERLISETSEPITLIEPKKALQAVISLHKLFSNLNGTVRICDPYLDPATIEHLDACADVQIRLLTKNVRKASQLRRLISAFQGGKRHLEIRIASHGSLHDRYILDDSSMLILGTSLNGFGKKQCFVVKAGNGIRNVVLSDFDSKWQSATNWT